MLEYDLGPKGKIKILVMFLVLLWDLWNVWIVIMLPCVRLAGGPYEEIFAPHVGLT
jgi:hypothetical protein